MAASSSAAAQRVTEAASLQLDLRSLGDRTARVSREQRIQVRRLQRQQAASHASSPAVPPASQLNQLLARGSVEVWVSAKSVGPVACTKPGRPVTQSPPAPHIAGNAEHNGRTQSKGQAAHIRHSQRQRRQQADRPESTAAQPSPCPKKQGLVSNDTCV